MGIRRGAWMLALAACGGSTAEPAPDASPIADAVVVRVPVLTTLRPAEAAVDGEAFVMELDGADLDDDAIVVIDSVALTTRVLSSTGLEADVPATLLSVPGRRWVEIVQTGEGGGTSAALPFDVVDGTPIPQLDTLVPDQVVAGGPGFVVTVHGWNFTADSVASWGGVAHATTFVGSAEVSFSVDAADVAVAAVVEVTVATPGAAASDPLGFTIDEAPSGSVGVIERVVTAAGAQIGNGVDPSISADGRYVLFGSTDATLGDGCCEDLFVRDTCRGAGGCTPSVTRVSVSMTGGDPDGYARHGAISATGRYVAFSSDATNLVAGAPTGQRVYVRDTCLGVASGCVPSTSEVSLRADGGRPVGDSAMAAISGDGRFVAFESGSADVVAGDTTTNDVYLRDTCAGAAGCTASTIRISESLAGVGGDRPSHGAAVSASGRFVAFMSVAGNLDGAPATMFRGHAYVRDTCAGVASGCAPSFLRADVGLAGAESDSGVPNQRVAISDDGRFVAFSSLATNLTGDTVSNYQVFVRDTCTGASGCTPSTTLGSANASGGGNQSAWAPQLSNDGRYLVFNTDANDLVAGDTNNRHDVFVRDLCHGASGCTSETRRMSVTPAGVEGDGHSGRDSQYVPSRVTADGALVVFASQATNLVAADTNGDKDVFLAATGFTP